MTLQFNLKCNNGFTKNLKYNNNDFTDYSKT